MGSFERPAVDMSRCPSHTAARPLAQGPAASSANVAYPRGAQLSSKRGITSVSLLTNMLHEAPEEASPQWRSQHVYVALTWRRSFSHAFSLAATTSAGSAEASAMISSKRDSSSAKTSKGCIYTTCRRTVGASPNGICIVKTLLRHHPYQVRLTASGSMTRNLCAQPPATSRSGLL